MMKHEEQIKEILEALKPFAKFGETLGKVKGDVQVAPAFPSEVFKKAAKVYHENLTKMDSVKEKIRIPMSRFKNLIVTIETEEDASRMIDFLQKQGFKKLQEYHRKHCYIATNEEGFFFYEDFENDCNHEPWAFFYSFKDFDKFCSKLMM